LSDLSGAILKKAELSKDFSETYSQVFKKILEIQVTGKEDVLEVLGNVGG
jgi:hypothetical protein